MLRSMAARHFHSDCADCLRIEYNQIVGQLHEYAARVEQLEAELLRLYDEKKIAEWKAKEASTASTKDKNSRS